MTEQEALKLALEFITASNQRSEFWLVPSSNLNKTVTAIRETLAQPEGCQCPACKIMPHASDCAVHNEPAYSKGACNCKAQPEHEKKKHEPTIDLDKYAGTYGGYTITQTDVGIGEPDVDRRSTESKETFDQQEPVPVTDNTYGYAKSLAEAIFKQHFASDEHYASGRIVWGVNDTVIGILTQIDNMVSGMVRKPAQPEQEPSELDVWKSRALQAEAVIEKFMAQPEPVIDKSAAVRIATSLGWEPKRTWVGLTDEEKNVMTWGNDIYHILELAEAKLKEKNNG